MSSTKHTGIARLAAAATGIASLALTCTTNQLPLNDDARQLIELSRDSNAALLRGDAARYAELVKQAEDFTLMSPFGGKPTREVFTAERIQAVGRFFRNGSFEQELVQAYSSPDMIVLATIERAHVEVGGLPAQNWTLRVTLVYRREGSDWRLVHRHADPLGHPISLTQAAALARGDRKTGD